MTAPGPWPAFGLALLDCLVTELRASVAGAVCRAELRHSGPVVPADDCGCECIDGTGAVCGRGQAWVRQGAATLASDNRVHGCPTGRWQVLWELGTRRCVAVMDEGGQPPPAEQLTAEAVWLAGDARAARRVLRCCPVLAQVDLSALSQLPVGPAGGCAGWVTTFTVALNEHGT